MLFLLTLGVLVCATSSSAERVYLDISGAETRKINFAVPYFTNIALPGQQQKFGMEVSDLLAKALKFHGIISIVPMSEYGGSQTANWKNYGTDYVVLGQYSSNSSGVSFEIRLVDTSDSKVLLGKTYSGTSKQVNTMIYSFCDEVIKTLTGTPGIANTQIAFVSLEGNTKEVFLTDILGTQRRQVTRHRNLVVSPRFTQGGSMLSYTSYHSGNPNLYITDLRQNKTTRAISRRQGMNFAPAWSPDGSRMVLTLSKDGNPDLYILDRQGEILDRLTKNMGINVSPTWSPDGSRIVFVSDRTGRPNLYLMDLASRKTQRITFQGSENAEPSWSPTEDLIAYSSLRNGVYQIYTVKPEPGAKPVAVTKDLSHHESPAWSPDGNQIIFSKRDGKMNRIYAIMKNGSEQRPLFSFRGSHSYPQWSR